MLLRRGFAEPLLESSHQNIFTRICQYLLPSYQLSEFHGASHFIGDARTLYVHWLILSSIQQDLNSARITTVATLQFQAIQQLY